VHIEPRSPAKCSGQIDTFGPIVDVAMQVSDGHGRLLF